MKKLLYIITLFFVFGCNQEDAPDCFQSAGDIIQQTFEVGTFSKITVYKNVELFVTQGATQSIVLETGENLINDVEVYVENDRLILKDNNTCNLTRAYGITKVHVTVHNLNENRKSYTLEWQSGGVVKF